MTDDNLTEFLSERVHPTREIHHVQYPMNDSPPVAVMIDSAEDGMVAVILPTIAHDLLHLEIHFFVDGERKELADEHRCVDGCLELTLRRDKLYHKEEPE